MSANGEAGPWIEAIGLLSTLVPDMEIDTSDPLGMARKIEARVRADREVLEQLTVGDVVIVTRLERVEALGCRDALAKLREFAEYIIRAQCWELDGQDGGDVQDKAVDLGLLVQRDHAQPCADEGCTCEGSDRLYYFAWK